MSVFTLPLVSISIFKQASAGKKPNI